MTTEKPKRQMNLWSRYVKIFVIVSCYWVVSISTVFVNKTLLSGQNEPLKAPLFITWFQCVISFSICACLSTTGGIYKVFTFPKGTPWRLDTFKKVVPLSIMFTLTIASSNLSLRYVSLSFYYIGRSLTTVFNVILVWVIMGQATSARCLACCAVIIFGFWLGVDQENLLGSFSLLGTIYGVVSSLLLALFSIYTKKTLPHVDQQVWLLTYCINAYSIILLMPLMGLNGEIQVLWNYTHFGSLYFWIQMLIGGVCGLAVGHFTSLQIQVTSPLTHNISGTAKACTQTILASQWRHEVKNALWWLSNAIVLVSSALYAWFKQMEMVKPPSAHQDDENPVDTHSTIAVQSDANTVKKHYIVPVAQVQGDGYLAEEYCRTQITQKDTTPIEGDSRTQINQEDTGLAEDYSRTQVNQKDTKPAK